MNIGRGEAGRRTREAVLDRLIDKTGRGLRRAHRTVLLAAITGLLTGSAVAMFEWVVGSGLLEHLERAPLPYN